MGCSKSWSESFSSVLFSPWDGNNVWFDFPYTDLVDEVFSRAPLLHSIPLFSLYVHFDSFFFFFFSLLVKKMPKGYFYFFFSVQLACCLFPVYKPRTLLLYSASIFISRKSKAEATDCVCIYPWTNIMLFSPLALCVYVFSSRKKGGRKKKTPHLVFSFISSPILTHDLSDLPTFLFLVDLPSTFIY